MADAHKAKGFICKICGFILESDTLPDDFVCPICRRLICDSCFLICEEMDMCRACAKRLKEDGEPVNL